MQTRCEVAQFDFRRSYFHNSTLGWFHVYSVSTTLEISPGTPISVWTAAEKSRRTECLESLPPPGHSGDNCNVQARYHPLDRGGRCPELVHSGKLYGDF